MLSGAELTECLLGMNEDCIGGEKNDKSFNLLGGQSVFWKEN